MPTVETLRRVPWTCRWGQFGGPIDAAGPLGATAVFWVCDRSEGHNGPRPLHTGSCEHCANWEPIEWESAGEGVKGKG